MFKSKEAICGATLVAAGLIAPAATTAPPPPTSYAIGHIPSPERHDSSNDITLRPEGKPCPAVSGIWQPPAEQHISRQEVHQKIRWLDGHVERYLLRRGIIVNDYGPEVGGTELEIGLGPHSKDDAADILKEYLGANGLKIYCDVPVAVAD